MLGPVQVADMVIKAAQVLIDYRQIARLVTVSGAVKLLQRLFEHLQCVTGPIYLGEQLCTVYVAV